MRRYICIHGHFYQPPRENPWLESIEIQDSAFPYHDWNEKIARECYGPNASARIVDDKNRILTIHNNYRNMSFNFGPTLLSWMEHHTPRTYLKIIEGDEAGKKTRSGHGNAIAQGYNHIIMPLAMDHDKVTQVEWGIRDFEFRFGRKPEGMWLPETAVDLKTLDILHRAGIKFTILAPHQARRIRRRPDGQWMDVKEGSLDTTRAYACKLPGGGEIALFFYNAHISRAVAFEGLLSSGDEFLRRLLNAFPNREGPQIVHIATDGESYGHHHKFGEMALTYVLQEIESKGLARLTNYGEYLAAHPPDYEVEIWENTSWSCCHGVERWRSDCGCQTGGKTGWNQKWRGPLRDAMEDLKIKLDRIFEVEGARYLKDPWKARNSYIDVHISPSQERMDTFIRIHQKRSLDYNEKVIVLKLMEMARFGLFMFTSCGWFFSDISGIETVQILQYAARAIQLGQEIKGEELEGPFLKILEKAKSNVEEYGDGLKVYEIFVRPWITDLDRVAAHYGISSLFEDYGESERLYIYTIKREEYWKRSGPKTTLAMGRIEVGCDRTLERKKVIFAVVHFGGHDFRCSVKAPGHEGELEEIKKRLIRGLEKESVTELVRQMDHYFGERYSTLKDLFLEERRKIALIMLEEVSELFRESARHLYEENRSVMELLREMNVPVPSYFLTATEQLLIHDLEKEIERDPLELPSVRMQEIVEEARKWGIRLETITVEKSLRKSLEHGVSMLLKGLSLEGLDRVHHILDIAELLGVKIWLWWPQNFFYEIYVRNRDPLKEASKGGGRDAMILESLQRLGKRLFFNID